MRVLITGGGGFIGSHLVEQQLQKGHVVRTIDSQTERLSHLRDHPRLEIVQDRLRPDPTFLSRQVAGVEIIYNLASAHLDVTLSEQDYWETNVEMVAQLVVAADQAGVRRFVHCSTNSVVGMIEHPPVDETAVCHPTNIYEETKLAGEQALLAYHKKTGFNIVIIRPAWVYGPRCPRTAKLFRTIGKGRFIMFGSGHTLRHPLYISDALRGLELAAEREEAVGNIYFLAGETAVSINRLTAEIAAVQDSAPPKLRFPLWMGHTVATLTESMFSLLGKHPPVSRRTLDFYTKHNAYDISKARHDLEFVPEVTLQDGLRRTWETFAG